MNKLFFSMIVFLSQTAFSVNLWQMTSLGAEDRKIFYKPKDEVIVAVLDSGLDLNHPQLNRYIAVNALEKSGLPGVDDDRNGLIDDIYGYDFFSDSPQVTDPLGHGTAVAGLIAARPLNGVEGLATSHVKILPIRIMGPGGVFQLEPALAGLRYAISRGAKVINLSWNTPSDFSELRNLFLELEKRNVLIINSAANEGELLETSPQFPTLYNLKNQINVANLKEDLFLSYLSNFSKEFVHLAAPGEKLTTLKSGGGITEVSGTSFATPLVSATAAMIWSMNPNFSAQQVKNQIFSSATPLLQLEGKTKWGKTLHLGRALRLVSSDEDPNIPQNWKRAYASFASDHPYAPRENKVWNFTFPAAKEIVINFSRFEMSLGDSIEVLDQNGKVLETMMGRYSEPFQTKVFPASISLRLQSDESLEAYGFLIKHISWR